MPSDIYDTEEDAPAHDAHWAARRRLASAVRSLNELTVTTSADIDTLTTVTAVIEEQAQLLANGEQKLGKRVHIDSEHSSDRQQAGVSYELNPVSGYSNPVAPPLRIWFEGDEIKARVTMGWQYEGPSGCVHGGFVAALFDDFLGMGQKISSQPGFTGTLSIRYVKPTPLGRELTLSGRVERVEGRKNILSGKIYAGDVLTASCEGLFVHMPADYLERAKAGM